MGPNSGQTYNWTNTSQWSQIPTTPVSNQSSNQTPSASNNNISNTSTNSYQRDNVSNLNSNGYGSNPGTSFGSPPETRRDMISRLYKSILGREADNAGLNYYLFNTSIQEHQIAKDMYESTEHLQILTKAKDVREMVLKLEEYSKRVSELERKLKSSDELCQNYKSLLDQERQMFAALHNNPEATVNQTPHDAANEYLSTEDQSAHNEEGIYLQDPFADDYKPKGKGIFGRLKSLFGK